MLGGLALEYKRWNNLEFGQLGRFKTTLLRHADAGSAPFISPSAQARQKREQLSEALENKVLAWVGLSEKASVKTVVFCAAGRPMLLA
jgi:hypothetical protein